MVRAEEATTEAPANDEEAEAAKKGKRKRNKEKKEEVPDCENEEIPEESTSKKSKKKRRETTAAEEDCNAEDEEEPPTKAKKAKPTANKKGQPAAKLSKRKARYNLAPEEAPADDDAHAVPATTAPKYSAEDIQQLIDEIDEQITDGEHQQQADEEQCDEDDEVLETEADRQEGPSDGIPRRCHTTKRPPSPEAEDANPEEPKRPIDGSGAWDWTAEECEESVGESGHEEGLG